jgi:hypothetical protein
MNQLTREQKLAAFAQLEKLPNVKRGTVFADELCNAAKLKFDHPLAGVPWRILGVADVPGFTHLEAHIQIGWSVEEERAEYTICTLCLPEEQFQRI